MSTTLTFDNRVRFSPAAGSSAPRPARVVDLIETFRSHDHNASVDTVTSAVLPLLSPDELAAMAQRGLEVIAEEVMAEVRADRFGGSAC